MAPLLPVLASYSFQRHRNAMCAFGRATLLPGQSTKRHPSHNLPDDQGC
jgi:hypothetical protein